LKASETLAPILSQTSLMSVARPRVVLYAPCHDARFWELGVDRPQVECEF
jgi:hypothetical protein